MSGSRERRFSTNVRKPTAFVYFHPVCNSTEPRVFRILSTLLYTLSSTVPSYYPSDYLCLFYWLTVSELKGQFCQCNLLVLQLLYCLHDQLYDSDTHVWGLGQHALIKHSIFKLYAVMFDVNTIDLLTRALQPNFMHPQFSGMIPSCMFINFPRQIEFIIVRLLLGALSSTAHFFLMTFVLEKCRLTSQRTPILNIYMSRKQKECQLHL